ncbi:hypothetical protein ABOC32_06735 [Pseudomonas sp. WOUb67]|uniref:hypothetical protein n=1 Tax=Pseudomonas sp. WOUb67 TaxID=3161136 RepID=UPI003CF1DD79
MEEPTSHPSRPVPDCQRDVQRKLGRCMLKLQAYEMLLKKMVASTELSGAPDQLEVAREKKAAEHHRQTLGSLVGAFTQNYLKPSDLPDDPEDDGVRDERCWVSIRFSMELPEVQYAQTNAALKELVGLRNDLVHHFLGYFDLECADGCAGAEAYLDERYESICRHYLDLCEWAKSMDEVRQRMHAIIETPQIREFMISAPSDEDSVSTYRVE